MPKKASHNDVVKAVAAKLRHYMEIKRLEDGFDLSGPYSPRLDHPPLKPHPTLAYDGLHDRPVKHYFRPQVRQPITQMRSTNGGRRDREYQTKADMAKHMKKVKHQHPWYVNGQFVYTKGKTSSRRKPLKKQDKPFQGGHPTLRMAPPVYISKGEAARLVNTATKLLVATETVDIGEKGKSKRQSAPKSFESQHSHSLPQLDYNESSNKASSTRNRPKSSKSDTGTRATSSGKHVKGVYVWDIDGRRHKEKPEKENNEHDRNNRNDSGYQTQATTSTSAGMYVTIDGKQADRDQLPEWLRREMQKMDREERLERHRKSQLRPLSGSDSSMNSEHAPHRPNGSKPKSVCIYRYRRRKDPQAPIEPHFYKEDPPTYADSTPKPPPRTDNAWNETKKEKSRGKKEERRDKEKTTRRKKKERIHEKEETMSEDSQSHVIQQAKYSEPTATQTVDEVGVQTGTDLLTGYDHCEERIKTGDKANYNIYVRTGNKLGASTKADVKVVLYGDNGRTESIPLLSSSTHKVKFQKGQEDVFEINTWHVGAMKKVSIGHDREELGYGWFLEGVTVHDMRDRMSYEFPCERWMSTRDGDGKTIRELTPSSQRPLPADSEVSHSDTEYHSSDGESEIVINKSSRTESTHPNKSIYSASHTSLEAQQSRTSLYSNSNKSVSETEDSDSDSSYTTTDSSSSETSTTRSYRSNHSGRSTRSAKSNISHRSGLNYRSPAGSEQRLYQLELEAKTKDSKSKSRNEKDYDSDKPQYSDMSSESETETEDETDTAGDETETDLEQAVMDTKDGRKNKGADGFMDGFKAGVEATRKISVESQRSSGTEDMAIYRGLTIHQAAKSNNLRRIQELANHNASLINSTDEKGWRTLHVATSEGNLDIVKWLSVNAANLNAETPTGYTAMHLGALNGHVNCMMVLAAMGASIACKSIDEQTPLHLSAMNGHLETVKWLVANRADLNAVDVMGRTSLELAEQYDHRNVINFLLSCQNEMDDPKSTFAQLRQNTRKVNLPRKPLDDGLEKESESRRNSQVDVTLHEPPPTEWSDDRESSSYARPNQGSSTAPERGSGSASSLEKTGEAGERSGQSAAGSKKEKDEGEEREEGQEDEGEEGGTGRPLKTAEEEKDLEEKRKMYEEDKVQRETTGMSFLDSLRAEFDDDVEYAK
ncbi:unnamed protein product [Owenia fusiformis]|uniref:PLAT domain-containing protein n=1 Tax=Owenia fusiformis TaxID=6347 RepID=A0A8S4PM60_OWEFU|nr:unnamed protein product [Owenia fusiformis]